MTGDDLYSSNKSKRGDILNPSANTDVVSRQGCGCMGLIMTLLIGLTIASIAAIFIIPFGTVFSEDFAKTISPLFCASDRTLIVRAGSSFRGQSSSFTMNDVPTFFYCANNDGEFELQDEITDRFTFVMVALGCMIPIFILAAVFLGVSRTTRRITNTMVTVPERYSKMVDLSSMKPKNDAAGDDISERLRELKDLYDQGLITIEEYSQKRQDILRQL